jgi:hypothetical protein
MFPVPSFVTSVVLTITIVRAQRTGGPGTNYNFTDCAAAKAPDEIK